MTWEMKSLVWFELNSNTPYLLIESLVLYSSVPHEFLSSTPPFDLQFMTGNEWLGLMPKERISCFGTAITGWPAEIALRITVAKSVSEGRYFLTGAPVRSLK